MRKRRGHTAHTVLAHPHNLHAYDDKDKHTASKCMQFKYECMVVLMLLILTFVMAITCFMFYGHFILCWLNVGMCTPIMDVLSIAYELPSNTSSVDNQTIQYLDSQSSKYHNICMMDDGNLTQNAQFKLMLLITDSVKRFKDSDAFQVFLTLQDHHHIHVHYVADSKQTLTSVYDEYFHWISRTKHDGMYIKVMTMNQFKDLANNMDVYRYIRCKQIGVIWLMDIEDDSSDLQSMQNAMTFYKYGGIRHHMCYYQHLHKPNYINMLLSFLQIEFVSDSLYFRSQYAS